MVTEVATRTGFWRGIFAASYRQDALTESTAKAEPPYSRVSVVLQRQYGFDERISIVMQRRDGIVPLRRK